MAEQWRNAPLNRVSGLSMRASLSIAKAWFVVEGVVAMFRDPVFAFCG